MVECLPSIHKFRVQCSVLKTKWSLRLSPWILIDHTEVTTTTLFIGSASLKSNYHVCHIYFWNLVGWSLLWMFLKESDGQLTLLISLFTLLNVLAKLLSVW